MKVRQSAALLLTLLLFGCSLPPYAGPLEGSPPGKTPRSLTPTGILAVTAVGETPAAPAPAGGGESLDAYFSNPQSENDGAGPERGLIDAVDAAQHSIDVAIYNISLDSLASALIDAHQRGVRVRMVMESEAMDRRVPQVLRKAGIPIVGDQREGLMHNKFTVIDGGEVWIGSMNYTESAAYSDYNNLLRIRDREVAENFTVNFEEMFSERRFGSDKRPDTPYPQTDVAGAVVESYFSPDDGVARKVLDALYDAQDSIDVLAYTFTRDDFAAALISRARAGVAVQGVFDAERYIDNTGGEFDKLRQAGLDVRLDGGSGLMHDKVFVIDRQVVISGSYNFTAAAERSNDESVVIVRSAELAEQYLRHFELIYDSAQ